MEVVIARSRGTARGETLASLLTAKRKAAGLSQVEVAGRLSRPQSFVASVESGLRRVDVVELLNIASAIGFDACEVLEAVRAVQES